MGKVTQILIMLGCCFCFSDASSQTSSSDQQLANKVDQFVNKMVSKHQFDQQYIKDALALANKDQVILDAIARPWEAKPWYQYYPIFLTEKRLEKGLAFWQKHHDTLSRAEKETGVPAQIITAIIGVETFYGTYKGKYSVLDALYTLGFHYPPRSKFFSSELEQYFLLTREEGFDLHELKGSYAGAMGWGQFISSSYRHYAVDFDGDGVRDLLNNPVDAIGSVANYFKVHGWKGGEDVAFMADIDETKNNHQALLSKTLKFKDQWQALKDAGIKINSDIGLSPTQSVKLLEFDIENGHEYWVGLPNFYVITRYNHSPLYAMAVYQFSEQLRLAMEKQ
ncbi:lytic murein transglycosylase B [Aliiglaciecola sp.]|nr:lytic murein transglycosylase B [Aliiglaciecola sp.]